MPKPEFPILHAKRLTLREYQKSDAEILFPLMIDENVSRYLIVWGTLKDAHNYVRSMRKQFRQRQLVNWVICDKTSGAPMGHIALQPIDRSNNSASVGFWLGHAFWGKGYLTEALTVVLNYAFSTIELNRVSGGHAAGNEASGRVQQKCGMQYEGTHRQSFLKKGQYYDNLMYAITKDDWLAERDNAS